MRPLGGSVLPGIYDDRLLPAVVGWFKLYDSGCEAGL